MNLYIFEPYEWAYCGGAIGVLADSYTKAVDLIVEKDKKHAKDRFETESWHKLTINDLRSYRHEYFSRTEDKFKKDHYDQWLLTVELPVASNGSPRVLFNNWNYA